MKKIFNKTTSVIVCSFILLYFAGIFGVQFLITRGYTNTESAEIVLPSVPESILSGEIVDISGLKPPIVSRIPKTLTEVYTYLEAYPEDQEEVEQAYFYLNPDGDNPNRRPSGHDGLNFIVQGLDTRKEWLKALKIYSIVLAVDSDLVYACVLGEQIRIASQSLREIVKEMVRL
jgi:hypothetical protein